MRIRQALSTGLLALTPALTGCLVHTHSVIKTRPPEIVLSTTLDHLLDQVNVRYDAIQSITISVHVVLCTGGAIEGEVKCYPSSPGHIVIGKPENMLLILQVPYLTSQAFAMTSDGRTFKLLIPPKTCAITGSDLVVNNSQKGMYSLRPEVILDSLMIHGLQSDQVVAMTQDSRTVPDPKKRKGLIDEPDYDLEFISHPDGKVAHAVRVIHISRVDLLPYRQDIYNADGKVATQAFYSNYKKFGDISFPTKIEIQRPLDEFSLAITVDKVTNLNQPLPADQFDLGPIPENYATYNMDDPAVAAKAPCAAHATQ